MLKFGIIGAGNMASAIAGAMLEKGVILPSDMMVCDHHQENHKDWYSNGAHLAKSESEVVENCEYVLLSIKPQGFSDLLAKLKPVCTEKNVFISIAAGISADYIKSALGSETKVVLVMPNTPVSIGFGASALAKVAPTSDDEFKTVLSFFSSSGAAVEIPSNKMNEVIPLNGSSPAFIYRIAQIFTDCGERAGFDRETALNLFCAALIGSAHMMTDTGKSLDELIKAVCSKGGTTLAGLDAMERGGLEKALTDGFDACVKRAYELGK